MPPSVKVTSKCPGAGAMGLAPVKRVSRCCVPSSSSSCTGPFGIAGDDPHHLGSRRTGTGPQLQGLVRFAIHRHDPEERSSRFRLPWSWHGPADRALAGVVPGAPRLAEGDNQARGHDSADAGRLRGERDLPGIRVHGCHRGDQQILAADQRGSDRIEVAGVGTPSQDDGRGLAGCRRRSITQVDEPATWPQQVLADVGLQLAVDVRLVAVLVADDGEFAADLAGQLTGKEGHLDHALLARADDLVRQRVGRARICRCGGPQ